MAIELFARSEADSRRGRGRVMRIVDAQIHLWGSGLPSNMAHRQVTSFTTRRLSASWTKVVSTPP